MQKVKAKRVGVKFINRLIVQNAENLVFASSEFAGADLLVEKYGKYRVEMDYVEFPNEPDRSVIQGAIMSVRTGGRAGIVVVSGTDVGTRIWRDASGALSRFLRSIHDLPYNFRRQIHMKRYSFR